MKPVSKYVIYITALAISILLFGLFQAEPGADETPGEIVFGRNLTDAAGKKFGLWVEENGTIEVYYKDGLRDGVCRSYDGGTGRLVFFGEFKNGNRVGIWYFFDREGYLFWKEKEIAKNPSLTIRRDDGKLVVPKFKSYIIQYYPIGSIKAEGIALYNEDPVIDHFKKGLWKYYDPSGKLIKTEDNN